MSFAKPGLFTPFLLAATLLLPLLPFLPAPANAAGQADAGSVEAAQQAVKVWLVDIDGDQWSKSWDHASPLFQKQVPREQWETTMIRIRGLLGSAEKRKLVSVNVRHSIPGAPDGQYVVLQFETRFEHKTKGLETITPMKDADGKWRVSGYYIR